MVTDFEHLPDEILLFICQYLRQGHIVQAFFNLNYRLNCTISEYTRSLIVSNYIDKKLLSVIGPCLQSLTIKNCNLTLNEISQASHIEELTMFRTDPASIPSLNNLTDLNIIDGPEFSSILTLFSKNFNPHSVYISPPNALTMPVFSDRKMSTVKQLAIYLKSPKDALILLRYCPELTCLNLTLEQCSTIDDEKLPDDIPKNLSIFSLRITYDHPVDFNVLKLFLTCLPTTLEYLSIEIDTNDSTCLDGQILENYFKEKFSKLIRFEFFILYRDSSLPPINSTPLKLPAVLKTFQNSYWSTIVPQTITGYYHKDSLCVHSEPIPIVQRRRYFLY